MIGYKNTISGGSSIMQPIRIPENTRNVILVMNLIQLLLKRLPDSNISSLIRAGWRQEEHPVTKTLFNILSDR